MTLLPVVGRELRVSARRPRLYWARFSAAGAAMVLVLWIWIMFDTGPSDIRARQIFGSLSVLAFVYAILAGVALTSDAISEEKREGTLGLLFLTDLSGYDVVLGKVFATSLNAFYGLLAIFPVMAIPLLLGGLTAGDFWRMALVLVNTLLFSVCLGIFVSSFSRHERKTQIATFMLILLFSAGFPAVASSYEYSLRTEEPSLYYPSPGFAFSLAFDDPYKKHPEQFWNSISFVGAVWICSLLLAGMIIRRSWQDRPKTSISLRWQGVLDRFRGGSPAGRKAYRTHLLDVNPFYWLAARDRLRPYYVMGFLLLAALLWVFLYMKYQSDMRDQMSLFVSCFLAQTVIKYWLASEAGRLLAEDRKSGALELTLSTPIKVREILDGQFLALARQFGWSVAALICLELVFMFLGARTSAVGNNTEWVLMCLSGMIIFIADLFVLPAVAMWLALTSKRASKAFAQTTFFVLLLPWLIFFGFLTLVGLSRSSPGGGSLVGAWFIISAIVDLVFFGWASGNLSQRFREIATQRFDTPNTRDGTG
jgi:ABC-type transport system involved in multi-copper enzyme maturation permease subunit